MPTATQSDNGSDITELQITDVHGYATDIQDPLSRTQRHAVPSGSSKPSKKDRKERILARFRSKDKYLVGQKRTIRQPKYRSSSARGEGESVTLQTQSSQSGQRDTRGVKRQLTASDVRRQSQPVGAARALDPYRTQRAVVKQLLHILVSEVCERVERPLEHALGSQAEVRVIDEAVEVEDFIVPSSEEDAADDLTEMRSSHTESGENMESSDESDTELGVSDAEEMLPVALDDEIEMRVCEIIAQETVQSIVNHVCLSDVSSKPAAKTGETRRPSGDTPTLAALISEEAVRKRLVSHDTSAVTDSVVYETVQSIVNQVCLLEASSRRAEQENMDVAAQINELLSLLNEFDNKKQVEDDSFKKTVRKKPQILELEKVPSKKVNVVKVPTQSTIQFVPLSELPPELMSMVLSSQSKNHAEPNKQHAALSIPSQLGAVRNDVLSHVSMQASEQMSNQTAENQRAWQTYSHRRAQLPAVRSSAPSEL